MGAPSGAWRLAVSQDANRRAPQERPDLYKRTEPGQNSPMKTKSLFGLVLGWLLLSGAPGGAPGARRNSSKKEKNSSPGGILFLGDSQSVAANSPGALLAKALGAQVLAKGGKTAWYFVAGPGREALNAALSWRPRWVVVFLGSNELANVAAFPSKAGELEAKRAVTQAKGHAKLKKILQKAGAQVLFVGPPNFGATVKSETGGQPLNNAAPLLVPLLEAVYSPHFIDARPLTPTHKGVHFFGPGEAKAFAARLAGPVAEVLR